MVQQQQQFAVLELWQLLLLELWPTFVPSTGSAAITNEAQYLVNSSEFVHKVSIFELSVSHSHLRPRASVGVREGD